MWLLDANLDVHLVSVLAEFGIECETAIRRDWGALSNGELVEAAREAGFTCLLTQDRLFAQSASETLKQASDFSLVVVRLPQNPWRQYIQQFREAWLKQPIKPAPGEIIYWPEG